MKEGWICPRCGKALAPWMPECSCHKEKTQTQTSNTFKFDLGVDYLYHKFFEKACEDKPQFIDFCDTCFYRDYLPDYEPCSLCFKDREETGEFTHYVNAIWEQEEANDG